MRKGLGINQKGILLRFIDLAILFFSCMVSLLLFMLFSDVEINFLNSLYLSVSLSVLSVASMSVFRTYRVIWRYVRTNELLKACFAIAGVWIVAFLIITFTPLSNYISQIYFVFAFEASMVAFVLSRLIYKEMIEHSKFAGKSKKAIRSLIVGAGFAGHALINEMLMPDCVYKPVVLTDDDKNKLGRSIMGVPVVGSIEKIPSIVKKYSVERIFLAIPTCTPSRKKEIISICNETGCEIKIIPHLYDLDDKQSILSQAKDIKIEDLLGREPISFDEKKNKSLIKGKVCLVTGGGGSIGSELCRQIAANDPKQLVIVDIYENNAYDVQQELLRTYGEELNLAVRIASVRDFKKLEQLFEEFQPELVFHAAAHKHVPLMEDSPAEAIKNNVFGTFNVANLADKFGCEKFVLVSTDKAVNPTNVMGATKRCCEMIVETMKQITKGKTEFVAVRFGNVLGSNGSVVPLFLKQIREGGPVTVTHPDIIRFFMTIPEATSLILQAASFAHGGEIFVLDMGEPVKILSLAENVIRVSGKKPYEEIKIEFTGLRPGEKLYEELLMNEEGLLKTQNNKIFIGNQIEIDAEDFAYKLKELKRLAEDNRNEECVALLQDIVPTFKRKEATAIN